MEPVRQLLTPNEVAEIFRVDLRTVGRWARRGRLNYILTPGNHRRYFADEVYKLASFRRLKVDD